MGRGRRSGEADHAHATPWFQLIGRCLPEEPAVAGVASGVQDGGPDSTVVGHVEPASCRLEVGVEGDEHLGAVPPDGMYKICAEPQPVLDPAIGVIEELDCLDPHRPGAGRLLLGSHPRRLRRIHAVDSGLTSGDDQVGDGLPL